MNREIKFRGIRIDNGEIVVGSLILKYGKSYICYKASVKKTIGRKDIWCETEVAPESVGQFTGLHDKNGVEIYENDYDKDYEVVRWCENRMGWAMATYGHPTKEFIHCNCYSCEGNYEISEILDTIEIIGNSFTNPELIK